MATTAVQSEVLALEKKYWDALKARDVPTMESLTADPCLVVGPQGASVIDRKQFKEMVQSDQFRVRSFNIDERNASIRPISNDVVAVAYKVNEQFEQGGKTQKLEAYDTSVWVREGSRWLCAAHTETIAQPPS